MRDITIVTAYYENPQMLRYQYRHLKRMPEEIRRHVSLIVVDDGSPEFPAVKAEEDPNVRLFRMMVDVRWNQDACRNLGVHQARTDWILLTDIDHVVPTGVLERILSTPLDPTAVYRFRRRLAPDMQPFRPHPNSWLMTRQTYEAIGGYDERFAGFYGTDGDFSERVAATASQVAWFPGALVFVTPRLISDACTRRYGRKEPMDREAIPRITAERAKIADWRPLTLSFPWREVA